MNNMQKALLIVGVAIIAGLLLYMLVPEMVEGNYRVKLVVDGRVVDDFQFIVGKGASKVVRKGNFTYYSTVCHYSVEIPEIKALKLGQYVMIPVKVSGCKISEVKLQIVTPNGYSLTYIPQSSADGTYNFQVKVLYHTKIAAFILGSSITLFVGSAVVPFVITAIYLTLALYLTGSITLTDPFTLYMSDICLVFLAGSAFELVLINTGLAERIAGSLRRMARSPTRLFAGTFLIGAFVSMWMSNTSATYLMLPVVMTLISMANVDYTRLAELTLIGLAAGTTAGGMTTLVGTPPNLIASGYVNNYVYGGASIINFTTWLAWGIPIFVIAAALGIAIFIAYYKVIGRDEAQVVSERLRELASKGVPRKPWSRQEYIGLACILTLVTLWATEVIHGIKTGVVGMIGLLLFLVSGVLKPKQVKDLGWEIVVLIGGGLTLGKGLMDTGFSDYLVQILHPLTSSALIAIIAAAGIAFLFGTIMSSNTAAVAFLSPLLIPFGYVVAPGIGLAPRTSAGLAVLLGNTTVNYTIALPISTPPSAIVYGTGRVRIRTLFIYGILWGLIGSALSLLIVFKIIPAFLPP